MDITNVFNKAANWQFLQEPIYRWFIFLIVLSLFLNSWRGVVSYMK